MKKGIVLFLLMISFVFALTTDIELRKFESYEFKGKNITLLNLNADDDKVIVCVNNFKTIVSDRKTVNGLVVDLKNIKDDVVSFELENGCRENCICDDSCDNNRCGIIRKVQDKSGVGSDSEKNNENNDVVTGSTVKTDLYSKKEDSVSEVKNINFFTFILIDIVVILGILVLLKRSFS